MENPIKFMESKDAKERKTIGETGGLGTVATRADIIEKLFNSFLIEKKDNEVKLILYPPYIIHHIHYTPNTPNKCQQANGYSADLASF